VHRALRYDQSPFSGSPKVWNLSLSTKNNFKDKHGNLVEVPARLDGDSNTSFISKNVSKKLGVRGPKLHLTMNLAGGQKKSKESDLMREDKNSTPVV